MKSFNRILSCLLLIAMLFTMLPVDGFIVNADSAITQGNTGTLANGGTSNPNGGVVTGYGTYRATFRVTISRDKTLYNNGTPEAKNTMIEAYKYKYPFIDTYTESLLFQPYDIYMGSNAGSGYYEPSSKQFFWSTAGAKHDIIVKLQSPSGSGSGLNKFKTELLKDGFGTDTKSITELAEGKWQTYVDRISYSDALRMWNYILGPDGGTYHIDERIVELVSLKVKNVPNLMELPNADREDISAGYLGLLMSLYKIALNQNANGNLGDLVGNYYRAIEDYVSNNNIYEKPVGIVIDTAIPMVFHKLSPSGSVYMHIPSIDYLEYTALIPQDASIRTRDGDQFVKNNIGKYSGVSAYGYTGIKGVTRNQLIAGASESLEDIPIEETKYGNGPYRVADYVSSVLPRTAHQASILTDPFCWGGVVPGWNKERLSVGRGWAESYEYNTTVQAGFMEMMNFYSDGSTDIDGFLIASYHIGDSEPTVYYKVDAALKAMQEKVCDTIAKPKSPNQVTFVVKAESSAISTLEARIKNGDPNVSVDISGKVRRETYVNGNLVKEKEDVTPLSNELSKKRTGEELISFLKGSPQVLIDTTVFTDEFERDTGGAKTVTYKYYIEELKIKIGTSEYEYNWDNICTIENGVAMNYAEHVMTTYRIGGEPVEDIVIPKPSSTTDLTITNPSINEVESTLINRYDFSTGGNTYAEVKSNTPNNEKYEAMAGIPSTEEIYFSAGGSEFKLAIVLQYWMNEKGVDRTYRSYYSGTDCEYNNDVAGKGDTWKGITVPSASGPSSSDYTLTHNGDGTVTATWTGSIPWTGKKEVNGSCPFNVTADVDTWDWSAYNTALSQAHAWENVLKGTTISWTAASDKQTREYTLQPTFTSNQKDSNGGNSDQPNGASKGVAKAGSHGDKTVCTGSGENRTCTTTPHGEDKPGSASNGTAGSYTITVTATIKDHMICGPCCGHTLPAIEDTWKQGIVYDYVKISQLRLYKIDQASVTGMEELVGTDEIFANIKSGDPTYFLNIAQLNQKTDPIHPFQLPLNAFAAHRNTIYSGENRTPSQSSQHGRLRYSVEPQQHDKVEWNEGVRTNKCDGLATSNNFGKSSSNNVKPSLTVGHINAWAVGTLYTNSSYAEDYNHHMTRDGLTNKTAYSDKADDKDVQTTEWKKFDERRRTKNVATVISDFLILQTSGGDQSIFYFHKQTEPTETQEHFQKVKATEEEMFTNNPASIFNKAITNCVGGESVTTSPVKVDADFINIGGYNGNYKDVTAGPATDGKYEPYNTVTKQKLAVNGIQVGTFIDNDPAGTLKRPARTGKFMMYEDGIQIKPTAANKVYTPNTPKVFYKQVVAYYSNDYDRLDTQGRRVGALFNIGIGMEASKQVAQNLVKWGDQVGLQYNTTYSSTIKDGVNSIVVYTPVSAEDATILPLGGIDLNGDGDTKDPGENRDQRADGVQVVDLNAQINKFKICPLDPALCEFRTLNCKYLQDTQLAAFDFEPTYIVTERQNVNGNLETVNVTKNNTYQSGGKWITTNKITGIEYVLPTGFTIGNSGVIGTGQYLNAFGTRWSIPFSDLGLSADKSNRVSVSMDFYMNANATNKSMLVSFWNYDFWINPNDGTNFGVFNTGDGFQGVKGAGAVTGNAWNRKVHVELVFGFNNVMDCSAKIDGVPAQITVKKTEPVWQTVNGVRKLVNQVTTVTDVNNAPENLTKENIGNTINIGSWGYGDSYPANFYIDNLEIWLKGGTHTHNSSCYTNVKVCETSKIHVHDDKCYVKEDKYNCDYALNANYQLDCGKTTTTVENCTGVLNTGGAAKTYYRFAHNSGCTYNGYVHLSTSSSTCSLCGHSCGGYSTQTLPPGKAIWYHNNLYANTHISDSSTVCTECGSNVGSVILNSTYTSHTHTAECYHVHSGTAGLDYPNGCYTKATEHKHNKAGGYVLSCGETEGVGAGTVVFESGAAQAHTVTLPAGEYKLEVWGAQGGNSDWHTGGKGGYSKGIVTLNKTTTLYIGIGGQGKNAGNTDSAIAGGYNGGGASYGSSSSRFDGASGGGATHIATSNGLLSSLSGNKSSVLIVAGGGGGAAGYSSGTGNGGYGGGATGGNGGVGYGSYGYGTGGSQSSAGVNAYTGSGNRDMTFYTGGFGFGGYMTTTSSSGGWIGGGGGGGYYGGGAGGAINSGGGGSGYIGGVTNGQTIAGNVSMPSPTGSTQIGQSGNGYVKITTEGHVHQGNPTSGGPCYIYVEGSTCSKVTAGTLQCTGELNTLSDYNTHIHSADCLTTAVTLPSVTFNYTGGVQTYTVPADGYYILKAWGASGGGADSQQTGSHKGLGGYTEGRIYLRKGETIQVYVGGEGKLSTGLNTGGGWNGGGHGGTNGFGGGGATDFRLSNDHTTFRNDELPPGASPTTTKSLLSRIMVAGGGGGADNLGDVLGGADDGSGGNGGNLVGQNARKAGVLISGTVATGEHTSTATNGGGSGFGGSQTGGYRFGIGESATYATDTGGAGGGYYGGLVSNHNNGGAGGGSSYISGHAGVNSMSMYGVHNGSVNHYSGKIFTNTKMEQGINRGDGKAEIIPENPAVTNILDKIVAGEYNATQMKQYLGQEVMELLWGPEVVMYTWSNWTTSNMKGFNRTSYGIGSTISAVSNNLRVVQNSSNWEFKVPVSVNRNILTKIEIVLDNNTNATAGAVGASSGESVLPNGTAQLTSFTMQANTNNQKVVIIPKDTWVENIGTLWFDITSGAKYDGSITIKSIKLYGYGHALEGTGEVLLDVVKTPQDGTTTTVVPKYVKKTTTTRYTNGVAGTPTTTEEEVTALGSPSTTDKPISTRTKLVGNGDTWEFSYTGGVQTFNVPASGNYKLEVYGAEGGTSGYGGKGGYAVGNRTFTSGQIAYIYVGGQNGWNGGGSGNQAQDSGGGATDIRVGGTAYSDRVIVAGGGGGYGGNSSRLGGAGGGDTGSDGLGSGSGGTLRRGGKGATQTSGGAGGPGVSSGGSGSLGQGGSQTSGNSSSAGGGGGGGYYGGGAGGNDYPNYNDRDDGGGGGGSGYVGSLSNSSMSVGVQSGNGKAVVTALQDIYSGDDVFDRVAVTYYETTKTVVTPHTVVNETTTNKFEPLKITYAGEVTEYKTFGTYTFTAPRDGKYSFEAWGASGSTINNGTSGKGGYTYGEITLRKGDVIYVYVGEKGSGNSEANPTYTFNGGGYSGLNHAHLGGRGGGATDFRLVNGSWDNSAGLISRIMVAGGGGAAGCASNHLINGDAGGLVGFDTLNGGTTYYGYVAKGGTQTSGLVGNRNGQAVSASYSKAGLFGKGAINAQCGGGGGGGYYGGGSTYTAGGAGGSSFISGMAGANAVNASGVHTGSANHYSGKVFTNTLMRAGNETMPKPTGGTEVGHIGDGYAKVTYITEKPTGSEIRKTILDNVDLIPSYLENGQWNPIFLCKGIPLNQHIHTDNCKTYAILNCTEPHHSGEHYDGSNRICWDACGNDNNHKIVKDEIELEPGVFVKNAKFLQIDHEFTVYFPNTGDFRGNDALGLSTPQSQTGYGYANNMDTTQWTREKRVKFPFNVIHKGEMYMAGNWIELDVRETYFDFYLVLANSEASNAPVEFEVEAINAGTAYNQNLQYRAALKTTYATALTNFKTSLQPKFLEFVTNGYKATDEAGNVQGYRGYFTWKQAQETSVLTAAKNQMKSIIWSDFNGGTGKANTNDGTPVANSINERAKPITTNDNKKRPSNLLRSSSLESLHGGYKYFYLDVIGRIGNFAIVDTEDYRFSNFFKLPKTDPAEWLVEGFIYKVEEAVQNYYLGDQFDIRGNRISEHTKWLNTYGTQTWMQGTPQSGRNVNNPNIKTQVLTGGVNNIEQLKKEQLRFGYDIYASINTIGNYQKGRVLITPYYYALNLETGSVVPLDVYISKDGIYEPVNLFNNSTNGKYNEPVYEYNMNLDWTTESGRRNFVGQEYTETQRVAEFGKVDVYDYSPYGENNIPPEDFEPTYVRTENYTIPNGAYNYLGNAQSMLLNPSHRTFVGSEESNGNATENAKWGLDKNPGDKIPTVNFSLSAQRWHFKIGIPSSSVFVRHGFEPTQMNIDEIMDNDKYAILSTLSVVAIGTTWDIEYKQPWVSSVEVNGKYYDVSKSNLPPIVAVFASDKSSVQDVDIIKTH